jgi:hypothetical protein
MSKARPAPARGRPALANSEDNAEVVGVDPYENLHLFEVNDVSAYGGVAAVNAARSRVVLVRSLHVVTSLFRVPRTDH